jgi:hypothetical protein
MGVRKNKWAYQVEMTLPQTAVQRWCLHFRSKLITLLLQQQPLKSEVIRVCGSSLPASINSMARQTNQVCPAGRRLILTTPGLVSLEEGAKEEGETEEQQPSLKL